MGLFDKKSIIKIAEDDLKDARLSSIDFTDESVRKRAFIDVLGARLAMKLLFAQKIQANNIYSLYTIHSVLEEIDLADIYYQGIKIDVRLVFNKNEIFIPRKHFEYDLLPDLYVVLCIKDGLSSAEMLGFFEPKNLDKTNANKDFYFCEYEKLVKPEKLKNFLDNFKKTEDASSVPVEITQNTETLFLSLVDKEISQKEKISLYKQLAYSFELREKAIEFENFEIISRAIAKNGTMLDDGTLDFVGGTEGEPVEQLEEEIVEEEVNEEFPESDVEEEPNETPISEESDEDFIDVENLPDFETEDEELKANLLVDDLYAEFEAEQKSKAGADGAIIAGGALVAAAGLGLAAELAKGAADATVATTQMQGAAVTGAANAAYAGIELGNEFFKNLPEIQKETKIDELAEFEDFTQNDSPEDNFTDLTQNEEEEEDFAITDELPDFDTLEEETPTLDDSFEVDTEEEEEEEESSEIDDESELFEITEADDSEQIEEPTDSEELPDFDISENTEDETEEMVPEVDIEEPIITASLHDLEAMEDDDEELNAPAVEINTKIEEEQSVQNEDELFELDDEIQDVKEIEETATVKEKLPEIEVKNIEVAEEIETDAISETEELEFSTSDEEVEDFMQTDIDPEELPSFHELVQKNAEENGMPDFEYLVQHSIDETELPDFEHLVQDNDDKPEPEEIETKKEEEENISEIEELPELEPITETLTKNEEPITTVHEPQELFTNEDLPGLNLEADEPIEDLQELQNIGTLGENESELKVAEETDEPQEEVFSLDDFDFNLLEEKSKEPEEIKPIEAEDEQLPSESAETLTNFETLEENEAPVAKIDTDSDDFISQVDEFIGEVELSEEQRQLLEKTLLEEDSPTTQESPPSIPAAIYPEDDVEFVQNEEDKDLLKVLFEKEKIDNLPELEPKEEEETVDSPTMASLKNKKMVIAASIAGVVLVSFVIGGSITSSQKNNLPNNMANTTTPANGQTQQPNDMSMNQPESQMNGQMDGQMNGQMNGQMANQPVQSLPGEDQQANSPRDMGKAVSDAFSSEPVNASISKIAWEVPEDLAYNDSFRKYLQIAGKNLKLNLQNDLLLATEMAYSNKVIVDLKIGKDGSLQSENVVVASGSKQIDKIVLQSVKETLGYLKMPSSELGSGSASVTLIINF